MFKFTALNSSTHFCEIYLKRPAPDAQNKRLFISWDEYYMGIALVASMRSEDPCCQVGACIKDPRGRVVGIGYNGLPVGFNSQAAWCEDKNGIIEINH